MRRLISHSLRKRAQEIEAFLIEKEEPESEAPSKLTEDGMRDKGYKPPPKIKPPRRTNFNKTDEKSWRREYQSEYRKENGNGYIKKNKNAGDGNGT